MIHKLKQSFTKFIATLKPMTFRQRIDYIFTYYKEHMLLALIALIILVGVVVSLFNAQIEIIFSGTIANLDLTKDGAAYLREDLFDYFGGKPGQEVRLSASYFDELFSSVDSFDYNYNAAMGVVAMVGAQSLDYMIMDEVALKFFLSQDIFMDLREFFTEEELAELESRLVYFELDDGSRYPVAVHIEDTAYAKDCIDVKDAVFFAFIANAPHMDACHEFWDYLNAWESAEQ